MAIPGHKTFHHPEVGDLTLGYQSMTLNGTPGQALIAYYAEPGTPEHDAVTLLDRSDADHIGVPDIWMPPPLIRAPTVPPTVHNRPSPRPAREWQCGRHQPSTTVIHWTR